MFKVSGSGGDLDKSDGDLVKLYLNHLTSWLEVANAISDSVVMPIFFDS
jgi:hypothetical protein